MAILKLNIVDRFANSTFEVQVSDALTGSQVLEIISEMRKPKEPELLLIHRFSHGSLTKEDSNSSINGLEHTTLFDAGVKDGDSLFLQFSIIC